jgi:hypothetical protein
MMLFVATPLVCCHSYYLADGSPLGKGFTSNADPYAHWAYNYFDTLQNYPTRNCTYANYNAKYHWVRWCQEVLCVLGGEGGRFAQTGSVYTIGLQPLATGGH